MSKRKRSRPGIFGYIWREILFAQYFEYESNQTPQAVADTIDNLDYDRDEGVWKQRQSTTVEHHSNSKGFDFHITRQRKHPGDLIYMTTARVRGNAIVDGGTGKTMIRGAVTFGRMFHGILVAYLLYLILSAPTLISQLVNATHLGADLLVPPFIWLLVGGFLFFYWRRIYADRNQLADYLEAQFRQADVAASRDRLSNHDEDAAADYSGARMQQERRQ